MKFYRMKPYRALLPMLLATTLVTPVKADDAPAEQMGPHEGHRMMDKGEALTGQSIYQIRSTWTDQHGRDVRLEHFRGLVVLLAMVYTRCDYACPRIISDMRRIGREVDAGEDELRFVLVSIDPEGDTVARLKEFGAKTGLTEQGWALLRSDEGNVRELAAVFGVQYRRTSEQDFAHSNVISVLDPDGEIAHQQVGLGATSDPAIAAIERLLKPATDGGASTGR